MSLGTSGHPDRLLVGPNSIAASVAQIAAWLARNASDTLTVREREMIEVVVGDIRRLHDDGRFLREDHGLVAELLAAIETLEAQLRSPRPHRKILGYAFSQVPGFVFGALSGTAGNYLTMLMQGLLR